MNRLSLQPKKAFSCLLLSCSHRSHQFTPLHAFQIDFPSRTVSIHLPHDSIVEGGKWDVMRCELSPRKCCCPHLSPDSASSVVCVHRLPSAATWSYLSIPLSGLFVCLLLKSLSGFLILPSHPYHHLYCLMFPAMGLLSLPSLSSLSSVLY